MTNVLFGTALRQMADFVESVLRPGTLVREVFHVSMLSCRQKLRKDNTPIAAEAFNAKMSNELLNGTLFFGLDHARSVIAAWAVDCTVTARLPPPARFRREVLRHVHSDVANDVSYARRDDAGRGSGC